MLAWLLRSVVLYALWLALVDNVHTAELIAGVPAALAAAALWTGAVRSEPARMRLRPGMLRHAGSATLRLVTETAVVSVALLRALAGRGPRGRFRAVRFTATDDGRDHVARRVLTEALGSLAPNRYVIGIDAERDVLLVHELVPSDKPLDPLGLG